MTKPIEPGCKALIIGGQVPQNNGKQVLVHNRIYPGDPMPGAKGPFKPSAQRAHYKFWLVEGSGLMAFFRSMETGDTVVQPHPYVAAREQDLLRIDDPDLNETLEQEKQDDLPKVREQEPALEDAGG